MGHCLTDCWLSGWVVIKNAHVRLLDNCGRRSLEFICSVHFSISISNIERSSGLFGFVKQWTHFLARGYGLSFMKNSGEWWIRTSKLVVKERLLRWLIKRNSKQAGNILRVISIWFFLYSCEVICVNCVKSITTVWHLCSDKICSVVRLLVDIAQYSDLGRSGDLHESQTQTSKYCWLFALISEEVIWHWHTALVSTKFDLP